jgi:hypothetical protein
LLFTAARNQKFNLGAAQNENSASRISFVKFPFSSDTKLQYIANLHWELYKTNSNCCFFCAAPKINFWFCAAVKSNNLIGSRTETTQKQLCAAHGLTIQDLSGEG